MPIAAAAETSRNRPILHNPGGFLDSAVCSVMNGKTSA
jgi:hypothetical protein